MQPQNKRLFWFACSLPLLLMVWWMFRANSEPREGALFIFSNGTQLRWIDKSDFWGYREPKFDATNSSQVSSITKIYLAGTKFEAELFQSLLQNLTVLPHVTTLDIGNNEMDATLNYLSEPISAFKNLKQLRLQDSEITASGAACLAKVLPELPNLENLSLGFNRLRAKGIGRLCESLKVLKNLKTLNLGWNRITPTGVKLLSEVLPELPNLERLDLTANDLGYGGGVGHICKILKDLKNLRTLDLSMNVITPKEAECLLQAIPGHPSLKLVDLCDVSIKRQEREGLREMFEPITDVKIQLYSGRPAFEQNDPTKKFH